MSTDLLFEHFDTLATAPDGIARLRELILQLAVQGKLRTQDENDEPASVLLEKIRKEKNQFEKTSGITVRKTKATNYSKYDVNHVPIKWECKRLEELSLLITKGATPTSYGFQFLEKGINFIKVENIRNGQIDKNSIKNFISPEAHDNQLRSILQKGDLLFSIAGSIGTASCFVRDEDLPANVNQALAIVRGTTTVFNPQYLLLFLRSIVALDQVLCRSRGGAMNNVSLDDIRNILVNIPPLAEQQRIVDKVDRLMALCDELEAKQEKERSGCLKLGKASLAELQNAESPEEFERLWAQVCDAFELILDCPENVEVLRQTILQLAVQGKLGTQNVGDEPVGNLVESVRREKERLINEGKIKNDGKYGSINDDEIPFSIPITWQWVRLGEITKKIGSGSTPRGGKSVYQSKGIPFVRSQNVWNNGLRLTDVALIPSEIHNRMSATQVKPRDILLNITGASIGRSSLVPDNFKEGNVSQHVSIIRTINENTRYYLHYCIISDYFQKRIMDVQVGMSREGLSKKVLKDLLIPLPPLTEQHRIVVRVDELMVLCDSLESRLKAQGEMHIKYMNAIVNQMAGY
jgi:type I restriction enzyme S subunit